MFSLNTPLLSIPLYYLLATYPHLHASLIALRNQPQQHDNSNPHGEANVARLKKRLTPRQYTAYERAERCHQNSLENMPLFVAAIFAGMMAEGRVGEGKTGVATFAVGCLLVRVAYTVSYLVTETVAPSFVRSALWQVGTIWAFVVLGRAAYALG